MLFIESWQLRSQFAARLSRLYGQEVPAYKDLVAVSEQVNTRVFSAHPNAQRLGTIKRVTAERHGAIRVGSPREMAQAAQLFAALGMFPTGYYDLRDARPQPIPVISTAFRPHASEELAKNPFRVFTSMLVPEDRRFFTPDQSGRLTDFISSRRLFPEALLTLANRAEADGGLGEADASEFLDLATSALALSDKPIDRAWYNELASVSGVAADIGGVESTHINHLTPRVLDIDDLYRSMQARGFEMIDKIQGPPAGDFPDLLLRQTSFRALDERRRFVEPDGSLTDGTLRVRFGEVEQRGIAVTPAGRELYDAMTVETERRMMESPTDDRQMVARKVWQERCPRTELGLLESDLAYFTFSPGAGVAVDNTSLPALVRSGALIADPIVYEDFLPKSAAGIFDSNLSSRARRDDSRKGVERDLAWLEGAIDRPVVEPYILYREQSHRSLLTVLNRMGIDYATVKLPASLTA